MRANHFSDFFLKKTSLPFPLERRGSATMEAAVPPWATERGWDRVGQLTGAGRPVTPPAPPRAIIAKPKVSVESNPWEGVLGPPAVESALTTKAHARADVSTLIKTPKEVWKAGKQPTEITTAQLPGTHAERAAAKRRSVSGRMLSDSS